MRTREQALAAVKAAEAALELAVADHNRAIADKDLSDLDLQRAKQLFDKEIVAQAALERAERVARASDAALDTAKAAISIREADLANARARLIGFDDDPITAIATGEGSIPMRAPVSGRVLRVMQESETTLPAGAPVLEIGDTSNGLEIVVELLSSDAVKVRVGNRVIVDNWGGQISWEAWSRALILGALQNTPLWELKSSGSMRSLSFQSLGNKGKV